MAPEHKGTYKEKRLFDGSVKAKERFRTFIALAADGVPEEEIAALYQRRAADIAALYREYVRYMTEGNKQKGKQLRMEEVQPMCEMLAKLSSFVGAGVAAGWLFEQIRNFLHVDNLPKVRKHGLGALLAFADVMIAKPGGLSPEVMDLLMSVIDWLTLGRMRCQHGQLLLPKGVRELREHRFDFLPKRLQQPRERESEDDCVDLLVDVCKFVAERRSNRQQLSCWWSALKGSLLPLFYRRDADVAGISRRPEGGLDCLPPRVHRVVCDTLLLPLLQSFASSVVVDTPEELVFVLRLCKQLVAKAAEVDIHQPLQLPGRRELPPTIQGVTAVFLSWMRRAGSDPLVLVQNADAAAREMAQTLTSVFDHMAVETRPAVDVFSAAAESIAAFFVTAQTQDEGALPLTRDTRRQLLRLWLAVCTRVFGRQTVPSALISVRDSVIEVVSRALWVQWILACPLDDDSQPFWTELRRCVDTAAELGQGPRRCPAVVCIPATAVRDRALDDVTSLFLERHWRRLVLGLLRLLLERCGEAELPRPFPQLRLGDGRRPADASPSSSLSATMGASLAPGGMPDKVDDLVGKVSLPDLAALWYKLFVALCGGSECAMPVPVHLQRLLTVADAGSDLIHASRAHCVFDRSSRREQVENVQPHLLMSCGRRLPMRRGGAGLCPSALSALLVPPCLRALRRQGNADFAAAGGARVAVATLCDLLCVSGGGLPESALSQTCHAIAHALSGADPEAAQDVLYRLFPAAPTRTLPVQHYLCQAQRGGLVLLGPVAAAAAAELAGPCGIEVVDPRVTSVRCAAAAVLTQAACVAGVIDELRWPDGGWAPRGAVAALLQQHGGRPSAPHELHSMVVHALVLGARCSQPASVASMSIKGLGLTALAAASAPEFDGELMQLLLSSIAARLTHPTAEVAAAAVSALTSVLLDSAQHLAAHLDVVGHAVALLSSALMTATHHYRTLRRLQACRALVSALTDILPVYPALAQQKVKGTSESVMGLGVDALCFCASSQCSRKWVLPDYRDDPADPPLAVPGVTAGSGETVVPGTGRWWDDAAPAEGASFGGKGPEEVARRASTSDCATSGFGSLQVAGEIALEQVAATVSVFPIKDHGPALASSVGYPPGAVTHLVHQVPDLEQSAEGSERLRPQRVSAPAVLTLGCDGGGVSVLVRDGVGRHLWTLKEVAETGDSVFGTSRPAPGPQRRSSSGAVVGRGRTSALHEPSPTGGKAGAPGDTANLALAEANKMHAPPYLGEQQKHPWEARMLEMLDKVPKHPPPPPSPSEQSRPAAASPPRGRTASADSVPRFLATGPLLEPAVPPAPTADPPPIPSSHCPVQYTDTDDLPDRDCFTVSVLYSEDPQTTVSQVLSVGAGSVSDVYHSFLRSLGWVVPLDRHLGFAGGVEYDADTCREAIYHASATHELVYHTATMVGEVGGGGDLDALVEQRRRLIATDSVCIVWCEGGDYDPNVVGGAEVVVIALHPGAVGGLVRVAIHTVDASAQAAVAAGPLFDGALVSAAHAGPLTRSTAINVLRALRRGSGSRRAAPGAAHARKGALTEVAQRPRDCPSSFGRLGASLLPAARPISTTPRRGGGGRLHADPGSRRPSTTPTVCTPPFNVLALDARSGGR